MMKNIFRLSLSILFIVIVFTCKSIASDMFAETAIGSKNFAMGQTATISYSDLFGSINYPANLSQLKNYKSAFYYSEPYTDTKNMRFGFSIPLKDRGTIGFSYFRFIKDDIVWRNSIGESEGAASYIQHEYVISYGNTFYKKILFGLNAKWIRDEFTNVGHDNYDQKNIGFDLSLGFFPEIKNVWLQGIGFGFTLKNVIQFNTEDDHIPRQYRLIAENKFKLNEDTILLALNYLWYENFINEIENSFHAGIDYNYKYISLRAGYNTEIFTFGAGLQFLFLNFDYGYGSYIDNSYFQKIQHNFTLSVQF